MNDSENKNRNNELLAKIEERTFAMSSNHSQSYFTYLGFIITITSALIWFKEDLCVGEKILLLVSVFSLIIGGWLYLLDSKKAIELVRNMYKIVAQHNDDWTPLSTHLQDNIKLSPFWEKLQKFCPLLIDFGILTFLIALILLVL